MRSLCVIFLAAVFVPAAYSQAAKPKPKATPAKQTSTKPKANDNRSSAQRSASNKPKSAAANKTTSPARPTTTRPAANPSNTTAKPKAKPQNTGFAAKPPPAKTAAAKTKQKPKAPEEPKPEDEKAEWEKAIALTDAVERISALGAFLEAYPLSEKKVEAQTALATVQAHLANSRLASGDVGAAAELFRAAVIDAPTPIPDALYNEFFAKAPTTIFFRGNSEGAYAIAKALEGKAATSVPQLLGIANFYMSVENGADARRVAETAAKLDPTSSAAAQALGLASRMEFQLDASMAHYARAVELDPESISARHGLAEMKRATGKADEAVQLYREILAKDEANVPARTGLVLSLFDSGDRTTAETELAKALEATPGNIILLAGAAYWYAANNEGTKAVELSQKAIDKEPRFIWSHIAKARGYLLQNKHSDAERTLLLARRYGNFPTLDYEIASIRAASGFYREAAEVLAKTFSIKGGLIHAKLGGQVPRESKHFTELVGFERRASIFAPTAADTPEAAARLAALLELKQLLDTENPDAEAVAKAADEFTKGDDKMKLHRQLFIASQLLDKRVALPKALEVARAAVENVDAGIGVPAAAGAVMASELYEGRSLAIAKGEYVNIPDVPKATLSSIVRGRIEEIGGWAQYQMDKPDEAVVRLKRAISVLPADSVWWRSSSWRLATALSAAGKDAEALEWYIRSYKAAPPDGFRYAVVEAAYRKVNGITTGLEARIGPRPASMSLAGDVSAQTASPTQNAEPPITKPAETTSRPVIEPAVVPVKVETKPAPAPDKQPTEKPAGTEPDGKTVSTSPATKPSPSPDGSKTVAEPEPKREESEDEAGDGGYKAYLASRVLKPVRLDRVLRPATTIVGRPIETLPPPASHLANISPSIVQEAPAAQESRAETTKTPEVKKPEASRALTGSELFAPVVINIPPPQRSRLADAVSVPPCKITVSDESVTLHMGRSGVAMIVGVDGDREVDGIRATSSSPADVSVRRENIDGVKTRALYVLRSVGDKAGEFQITFEMPCGKKTVTVQVL